MIGIVDYNMGNLSSVYNAFDYIGEDVMIIDDISKFDDCSHLVIPGVGTYKEAMKNLHLKNYIQKIDQHKKNKKPILGICLGMQILSTYGTEPERTDGLDFIKGCVQKISMEERISHVGWNEINIKKEHILLDGIKKNIDFYFVHSYYFNTLDESNIIANTEFERKFPSIIGIDNIIGVQFHPEKSQKNGLKLLENFAEWDGLC